MATLITDASSVGNDPELELAKLSRLLCGLVLYASLYMLVRLAIRRTVLRTSSDAERDLEILALRQTTNWVSPVHRLPPALLYGQVHHADPAERFGGGARKRF